MSEGPLLADFVEIDVVATELKKSSRTIKRYTQRPDGMPFVRLGNRLLFNRESVRNWIASLERRPNQRRRAA